MKKRFKIPYKASKKSFTKYAKKTHRKNIGPSPRSGNPMRGGIRL